jgi:hypothetical protein
MCKKGPDNFTVVESGRSGLNCPFQESIWDFASENVPMFPATWVSLIFASTATFIYATITLTILRARANICDNWTLRLVQQRPP